MSRTVAAGSQARPWRAADIAFGQLRLHRLQAETLLHDTASRPVPARNGFRAFAVAPSYLKIAGRWPDFVMYQLINPQAG